MKFKIQNFIIKRINLLPDRIAGIKGAVSLGSNYCGRGTDIQFTELPIHVIVSFYSSNVRVMDQAFGRTARQGQKGTCRCICLKEQYMKKMGQFNADKTKEAVNEFEYKIESQQKFIEHYKKDRPWIFDFNIGNQKIPKKNIETLRKSRLNVNRIVAYKYKFPICMSIETFLKIQTQKIFSLFNCPNSKYTWRLFQRHVREMILQSWSIMIQNVDQMHDHKNFKEKLDCQIKDLHKKIRVYLPLTKHFDIVSTFVYIYSKVHRKY